MASVGWLLGPADFLVELVQRGQHLPGGRGERRVAHGHLLGVQAAAQQQQGLEGPDRPAIGAGIAGCTAIFATATFCTVRVIQSITAAFAFSGVTSG